MKTLRRDIIGIPPLTYKQKLVTSGSVKSQALSDQYEKVFTEENLSFIPYKGQSPYGGMNNIMISVVAVEKLLRSLNPPKKLLVLMPYQRQY